MAKPFSNEIKETTWNLIIFITMLLLYAIGLSLRFVYKCKARHFKCTYCRRQNVRSVLLVVGTASTIIK